MTISTERTCLTRIQGLNGDVDTITIELNDNGNTGIGGGSNVLIETLTVDIAAVNDAPVANADSFTIAEDGSLQNEQLLSNDTDLDGDNLTVSIVTGPNRGGTVEINEDGTFDYQPLANFFGTETFEYEVNDGNGGVARTSVTIDVTPVNDAPITQDDFFEILAGEPLVTVDSILENDFDIENTALTAVLLSGPSNGSLIFESNGQFTFTPNAGFTGVDQFTYLASDGGSSTAATVQISVGSAVGPAPQTMVVNENTMFDPVVPEQLDPPSNNDSLDDTLNDDSIDSEEEDSESIAGQGVDLSLVKRSVPVLDLQQVREFEADGDFEDLIITLADQERARAVLKAILQDLPENDLVENRLSQEIEAFQSRAKFAKPSSTPSSCLISLTMWKYHTLCLMISRSLLGL